MKLKKILPRPVYKAWRRAWGRSWLDQEIRLLRAKRIPWSLKCRLVGHEWGDKSPVVTVGPLGVPPRERDYQVLAFHRQCGRCYLIENVPYTVHEKLAAIEDAIREDLGEWPALKELFAE